MRTPLKNTKFNIFSRKLGHTPGQLKTFIQRLNPDTNFTVYVNYICDMGH